MKPDPKERKHKELKRLFQEYRKASEELFSRSTKLEKPVFAGYTRTYVIREDVARSPYANEARIILDAANTVIYSKRPDFKHKKSKSKQLIDVPQPLAPITKGAWLKNNCDEIPVLKRNFKPSLDKHGYSVYYFTGKSHWFELKVSKYYYTHIRDINGTAASKVEKITQKLDQEKFWAKEFGSGRRDINRYYQDPCDNTNWNVFLDRLVEDLD